MKLMRVMHSSGQCDHYTAEDAEIDAGFAALAKAMAYPRGDDKWTGYQQIAVAGASALYLLNDIVAVTVAPISYSKNETISK